MKPIRIVVVEDHTILRDGLVSILGAQPDFEVVGKAGSVAGALDVVAASRPDVVLMDYGLPDGSGLEATRKILAAYPNTDIVLLTVHEEDDLLFAAIRSGARGYLLKNISAQDMLAKLRGLAEGDAALLPEQSRRIFFEFSKTAPPQAPDGEAPAALTDRELEVLQLLVRGASNGEIAAELTISVHTVKNHVHNILDKLNVDNRHEAAALAVEKRLVNRG